jgi:hypothetical protein
VTVWVFYPKPFRSRRSVELQICAHQYEGTEAGSGAQSLNVQRRRQLRTVVPTQTMSLSHVKSRLTDLGAQLKDLIRCSQMMPQCGQSAYRVRLGKRPSPNTPKKRRRYLDGRDTNDGQIGAT